MKKLIAGLALVVALESAACGGKSFEDKAQELQVACAESGGTFVPNAEETYEATGVAGRCDTGPSYAERQALCAASGGTWLPSGICLTS